MKKASRLSNKTMAEIARLKDKVQHAEENGGSNTSWHQTLNQMLVSSGANESNTGAVSDNKETD